jgi:peptidoglycan/LPS O-acetylase OafA/YrhL
MRYFAHNGEVHAAPVANDASHMSMPFIIGVALVTAVLLAGLTYYGYKKHANKVSVRSGK